MLVCLAQIVFAAASPAPESVLLGRAVLPARTFAAGPPCGRALTGRDTRGEAVPFCSQPVQGISSIAPLGDGAWLALADNGFGSIEDSWDFHLRVYRLRIGFDPPQVDVLSHVELRDPDRLVGFPIVRDSGGERILTGADFDPESLWVDADGSLWIGEEFGPYLLHFSPDGRLLEPPFSVPDPDDPGAVLAAPLHPRTATGAVLRRLAALAARGHAPESVQFDLADLDASFDAPDPGRVSAFLVLRTGTRVVASGSSESATAKALAAYGVPVLPHGTEGRRPDLFEDVDAPHRGASARSRLDRVRVRLSGGFEGLAGLQEGRLLAVLEKPLRGSGHAVLGFEFDIGARAFVGVRRLPLEPEAVSIGEAIAAPGGGLLTIERDDTQGRLDGFKRIFHARFGPDGRMEKTLVADLLRIGDPRGIAAPIDGDPGGEEGRFAMPFLTIESLAAVDEHTLLVANDNNFPLTCGRHVEAGAPDDTEFVLLAIGAEGGK